MLPSQGAHIGQQTASHTRCRPHCPRQPAAKRPKRHALHVVAAGVPSAGSPDPITRDQMIEHLRSGCKPPSKWRIGTEHEKLGFNLDDHRRIDYDQINQVFSKLTERFGWQPMKEGELVIGVQMDGQSVTLEPGGQFELSGAPVATLHQTCAEVNSHLYQVKTIGEELGIAFLGIGFDPKWRIEEIPIMPKNRYRLMKSYMPTVGSMGLDMMFRTSTVQVNLDFESESDMVDKFRIGLALQPIAVALFANSPFKEGKPTGFLSTRGHVWTDVDASRTGNLPFVFEQGMGFERYVDYAMDVPMYFVYRDGKYVNALGQSWRDFMQGKLPALPGQRPTLADWENHLTTIFPEVRLKRFLEMRGADSGPWRMICALPALWVGLLYDADAQAAALDLISDWTQQEMDYLRAEVPRQGLATPFRDGTVRDVAAKVLDMARGGLERRGSDEVHFLTQLQDIVDTGITPASHLVELYNGRWQQQVDPIYDEFMY